MIGATRWDLEIAPLSSSLQIDSDQAAGSVARGDPAVGILGFQELHQPCSKPAQHRRRPLPYGGSLHMRRVENKCKGFTLL